MIPEFRIPHDAEEIFLHTCCAPCAGSILKRILEAGARPAVFFYNPNIHPRREYDKRKAEIARYVLKLGLSFIDGDYDGGRWMEATRAFAEEPERGRRCGLCFDLRLGRTAQLAADRGYTVFSSTLGISRFKDFEQVTRSGHKAAGAFPGLVYWDMNWRKNGGAAEGLQIARSEGFYVQNYCGCVYSLEGRKAAAPRAFSGG